MQRQRGGSVPIGEVFGGLNGPVKALREATPQARHHFTQADQVDQLVSAREADPDLGFMGRTMALCSLPRTLSHPISSRSANRTARQMEKLRSQLRRGNSPDQPRAAGRFVSVWLLPWQPWEKRASGLEGSMSVERISILTEVWSRGSLGWGCALAHGIRNDLSPRRTYHGTCFT